MAESAEADQKRVVVVDDSHIEVAPAKETAEPVSENEEEHDKLVQKLQDELQLGEEATPKRALILLDFNNMLVFRDKKGEVRGKADYSVRYSKYWMRPYAREFLCRLLNDPRCKVAIYTSIERRNMEPVIRGFDDYYIQMEKVGALDPVSTGTSTITSYSSLYDGQIALFDQKYNSPDPSGKDKWDTMRDLDKIWAHKVSVDNGFDDTNTLMVEGDKRKVRNWMQNAIIVKEYTNHRLKTDDTLEKLANYICDVVLAKMQGGDSVPSILSKHPME